MSSTTLSRDGTRIAFDTCGEGTPVILVDGALCYRKFGPMRAIADRLSQSCRVVTYDRRGRGESANAKVYSVEREVEDLGALIHAIGGSAAVFGLSSGAALALEAARQGLPISKLALYEAPFIVDATHPPLPSDYLPRLRELVTADRRGDAVRMFMKLVGVPGFMITVMRLRPAWGKLKQVAHTLPYDISIVAPFQKGEPLPHDHWSAVTAPALVLDGGKSPAWIRHGMKQLTGLLPNAVGRTLAGQTHMIQAKVLSPVLLEFLAS